jgi:hypothetical protein
MTDCREFVERLKGRIDSMLRVVAVELLCLITLCHPGRAVQSALPDSMPRIRTYYIAADEVESDYAPGGVNKMMGMKFDGYSKVFVERGPHRIGSMYRKALYREYTDETFARLKPRPAEWESSGILGPILRAEVGDTIRVFFKNNARRPYSMHPHGVFYKKDSQRAHSTRMGRPVRTKSMMLCRPARSTFTPGKYRNGPALDRMIQARSCGSTTRTPMK